ncbi:RNA polymerase sigma factor, partial [Rhizorhabdus sp. FW153]|uniref:RNA polymerase sigma factor n=1 Tax=Rhizorhabdus sp. FW153 TaxID=3400216 RepID=UPI003CE72CE6
STCPPPRLAEDDPFPPEDRVRVRPVTLLDTLYRAQAPKLLRFFARRTGRDDDAQDLVQESFDRFVQADVRATPIEQPEAYLGQIAKNLLRNRARAAIARSMVVQSPELVDRARTADPTGQLEARADLKQLEIILANMRPKTRDIFIAHRIEGLSYKDIAERTGLSVKGVEWQMSQAIQQIDRAMRRS